MIFFALVIAVTVFELTRAEISLTSDTANLIFLIEAGFFALIAISGYFSTRKTFRCPNCHADFSMKHVQSVGDTPLFECVECGEREYIQMDHGGGGGGGDGGGP